MPYYLVEDDRVLLKKLKRTCICSVCGGGLEALYDIDRHLSYLQCKAHSEHEGISKPNKKEENSYEGGLRIMAQVETQHGIDKARQLAKYQGVTSLSRSQAMEIMETIWPDAPAQDKMAAAILCVSYGLNPLANHVFLIPFEDATTGKVTWTRVWGIKAKRLVASRRGAYSYLDMTPRLMTEQEQIKVWGAVDTANLCYLTLLKDMKTGAEAPGYGKWPKNKQPKGTNVGNSQANMASIRSESQALERLRPAEMPSGFTVADEEYIESEVGILDTSTGEITEQTGDNPAAEPTQHPPQDAPGTQTSQVTQRTGDIDIDALQYALKEQGKAQQQPSVESQKEVAKQIMSKAFVKTVDAQLLGIDIDAVLDLMIDKGLKTAGEQRQWLAKTFPGTSVSGPLSIIIGKLSPEKQKELCDKVYEATELKG